MNFNFRFSDMIGDNFRLHFDDHTDEILKHPLRMFLNVQLFLCLKKGHLRNLSLSLQKEFLSSSE